VASQKRGNRFSQVQFRWSVLWRKLPSNWSITSVSSLKARTFVGSFVRLMQITDRDRFNARAF